MSGSSIGECRRIVIATGEPAPPTNLSVQLPTRGVDVTLSWVPGFYLEGEDVTFVITYTELESGNNELILSTNLSSAVLNPTSVGSLCRQYRFTVHSENLFGPSVSDVSHVTVVPTGMHALPCWQGVLMLNLSVPLSLDSNDINSTLSYEDGTFSAAMLSFDVSNDAYPYFDNCKCSFTIKNFYACRHFLLA